MIKQFVVITIWIGIVTGAITLLSGHLEPFAAWVVFTIMFWPPFLLLSKLDK